MSLYSALAAGASGLSAYSAAMAATADNVNNIQSTGYKGTDTRFKALVAANSGRGYSAGGVEAIPRSLISLSGLIQNADRSTDMAIDGAGFFAVRQAPDSPGVLLTRAGSFGKDVAGNLRNVEGMYLQGWPLDANGQIAGDGDLASLTTINTSGFNGGAEATTQIDMRAQLSSAQPAYAGPPAYAAGSLANGTIEPHFTRAFDVYDAQGNTHRVTVSFLKTAANTWATEVYANPSEVTQVGGVLATGTVRFNPDGTLDRAGSTAALFNPLTITYTNGAGSAPLTLGLGTDDEDDGLFQRGETMRLLSERVNGAMLSEVSRVEVSEDGIVSAIFEDGTIRAIYQLPVVTVANPDGLKREAGNAFSATTDSGNYTVNLAGQGGSGLIDGYALEASNVDLGEQFTKMITIQRAYSAAGKIIQTSDEMLQELGQLKR